MEWLYAFLHKLYEPYPEEDQKFIKSYWDIVFNVLLDYHQMNLEKDLDNSLFYALPESKRFWKGLETKYEWQTYTVAALPYRMPNGISEYKAYGAETITVTTATLPVDMGSDATILEVTGTGLWKLDGAKILGTGTVTVRYSSSLIESTTISSGYLTTTGVTSLSVKRTPYSAVTYSGKASIITGGYLYDPFTDFSSLPVGTQFTIGATAFELASILDKFTVVMTAIIPGVGRDVNYSHIGFGYVVNTTAIHIPNFDNGLLENIDYIIRDGYLGLASKPDDVLIAERVFFENAEIFAKFGALIGLSQDDGENIADYHKRVQALWYGLYYFANRDSAALVAHAFLGLPWLTPSVGELTVTGLTITVRDAKDFVTFTKQRYDVISCTENYFEPSDQYVQLQDGSAMKIVHYIDANSVTIDGPAMDVGDTVLGRAAMVSVDAIECTDAYNMTVTYPIPFGCVSYFGVGDTIPVWSRICTGVRVYDAHNRDVSINDSVIDSGFNVPSPDLSLIDGYTEVAGVARDINDRKRGKALRASVFIVEFDVENVLDMGFMNTIKPEHVMFQEINRDNHIGIYETVVVT